MVVILVCFLGAFESFCCTAGCESERTASADERPTMIALECDLGHLSEWHCLTDDMAFLFFQPLLAWNQVSSGWGHILPCYAYTHKWYMKTLKYEVSLVNMK